MTESETNGPHLRLVRRIEKADARDRGIRLKASDVILLASLFRTSDMIHVAALHDAYLRLQDG